MGLGSLDMFSQYMWKLCAFCLPKLSIHKITDSLNTYSEIKMTDFIWVPSKIKSIILIVLIIILLQLKKKISIIPFSLNGAREVIPELQKDHANNLYAC